jgi:uncharacterized membrane protein
LFDAVINFIKNPYLIIILLTFLPFLELRASIPYAILIARLPWHTAFMIACIANIILALLLYFFLDKMIHWFFFIKPFHRFYIKKVESVQEKAKPAIEKYGILGLALFIGIPLPGSGVYTGALASYLLGMGYKKFLTAASIGVIIAGVAVTIITVTAGAGSGLLAKLFLKI